MVAAFDYCLHGKGGAAPSIDTAMHGLVDAAHVDHLHPDSGIALATAVDGEEADRASASATGWCGCRGGAPASSSAWTSRRSRRRTRRRSAASWAGTASPPGATPASRPRRTRWRSSAPRSSSWPTTGPPNRSARWCPATSRCRRRSGAPRPRRCAPTIRGLASADRPQVGHYTDSDVVLEFLSREKLRRAGRAGHVLPGSLPADQGQAAGRRPAGDGRRWRRSWPGCRSCTRRTAPTTRATTTATPPPTRPAIRGADPAIVLVPGVGMFSFGKDKQTARVAGEFYVNAINVMRGAESVSTYAADQRGGEVRHRVLGAGRGQAATDAEAEGPGHPGRAGHRRRLRHREGHRRPGSPPRAAASSSPT